MSLPTTDDRWFLTSSGRRIYPFSMRPHDVMSLSEIAHSLSHVCRFGGHCLEFYTVAQHSVMVYEIVLNADPNVDDKTLRTALMHDSAEAYVGDMVRPVKRSMFDFCQLEMEIYGAIAARYDLHVDVPDIVKWADNKALMTERRDLLPKHSWAWFEDQARDGSADPLPGRIVPMSPRDARHSFLTVATGVVGRTEP